MFPSAGWATTAQAPATKNCGKEMAIADHKQGGSAGTAENRGVTPVVVPICHDHAAERGVGRQRSCQADGGRAGAVARRVGRIPIAALAGMIFSASPAPAEPATPTSAFLDSIGVVTTFPDRGQPLAKTVEMVVRRVPLGPGRHRGTHRPRPHHRATFLDLHRQTGVSFSWGLVSGGSDLNKLIETARPLAAAGALLAFEGNNEPNNWGVTYQGEQGGGRCRRGWRGETAARLYEAVKGDPQLKSYPVWSVSEAGPRRETSGCSS